MLNMVLLATICCCDIAAIISGSLMSIPSSTCKYSSGNTVLRKNWLKNDLNKGTFAYVTAKTEDKTHLLLQLYRNISTVKNSRRVTCEQ